MQNRDFDAAIYVKDAPEFRFEDGMFHVCHTSGKMHVEFIMRPNTFLKGLRDANKVADEFHAKGDVVGIKGRG